MKERFQNRKMTGSIKVACKFDNGEMRYWNTTKEGVCNQVIAIVNEYTKLGYRLTLRQLHYQMVVRNWIVNHDSAYKKLGNVLDDLRYSGRIDWDAIEDRGRIPYIPYYNEDATEAIQDAISQFRIDRQEGQPNIIELWTEKDALSGILKKSTQQYHVRLVVNKGYTSSSAMYASYKRCCEALNDGRKFVILYFGDHDPSGLDMIRDIRDRMLQMLCRGELLESNERFIEAVDTWWYDNSISIYEMRDMGLIDDKTLRDLISDDATDNQYDAWCSAKKRYYMEKEKMFQVIPIGLTMDQIEQYRLPENPTKLTDSRAAKYIETFGHSCWEVDALKPQVLTGIVDENILLHMSPEAFKNAKERERAELTKLKNIIEGIK